MRAALVTQQLLELGVQTIQTAGGVGDITVGLDIADRVGKVLGRGDEVGMVPHGVTAHRPTCMTQRSPQITCLAHVAGA